MVAVTTLPQRGLYLAKGGYIVAVDGDGRAGIWLVLRLIIGPGAHICWHDTRLLILWNKISIVKLLL